MDWKEEVKQIVMDGCSDSDIEDLLLEHPELNPKEVWDYVYELEVPENCKGCKHVQRFNNWYPCNACSRNRTPQDFYEKR